MPSSALKKKNVCTSHTLTSLYLLSVYCCFFFFNDTATTEIYTLSLHDALPICLNSSHTLISYAVSCLRDESVTGVQTDRKSTRLNSNHTLIPYAVFFLQEKTGGGGTWDAGQGRGDRDSCTGRKVS